MSERPRVVLVVDEAPETVAAVREALSGGRYRVLAASDPALALGLIEREGVDVVLGALDDPGSRGLSLLLELRRRLPLLPRIAVSEAADLDRIAMAVNEAEIVRFLRKPIEPAPLVSAIEGALGRAETLHETREVREAAERRRISLTDLENACPGISLVARGSDGYFIPRGRLRGLAERLAGTPLAPLLPDWPDAPAPGSTP